MSTKQEEMELGTAQPEITEVDKYEFEPIQGYPMLNWRGKRPFRSTQYYPAQLKETHGPEMDGWRNKIFWGDNLQVMSHLLKEYRGQIKLIYIDPPYDSKAEYKISIKKRTHSASSDISNFEEKQYSDIWTNDEYLQFMYERLTLIKELLSDDGALYLHCDWHKVHHLRCIAEEIFGPANFRNQIIWAYPGREMHITNKFNCKHDVILFFSRSRATKINMSSVAVPYEKEQRLKTLRRKVHVDDDGKEWVWETRGQSAGQEAYKRYVEDIIEEGKALNDVWTDLQFLRGNDPQRTAYPTQKPENIVERIIKASSDPGDLVFDCFMGSGTMQSVAMKLGRRFIGADINLGAIQTTSKRLISVTNKLKNKQDELIETGEEKLTHFTGFEVYNVNHYDVFRNPLEAKDLLTEALEIQKLEANNLYDGEKDGRKVKIMPVNRIATKADLNELISGFDYKAFERRQTERPNQPVEKLLLICMGHEADLAATLQNEVNFKLDIEVVDILRDKSNLEFKRDAEAKVAVVDGKLVIEQFYPMNLLQKLSLMKENVENWRELVESVMVDWNYDGAVLEPAVVDLPGKDELVSGEYPIPEDAGTIRVKITDLLSESLEVEVTHG